MSLPAIQVRFPARSGAAPLRPNAAAPTHTLADRLAAAGRRLNTRCGGRGLCAGCTVALTAGTFVRSDGAHLTAPAEIKACQGDLLENVAATVAVPARSLLAHAPQVVSSFKLGTSAAHDPIFATTAGTTDHGLAIDIGTTTVVVALVDLTTGAIVAQESAFNRQLEYGDDVITRIQLAGTPVGRAELQVAIVRRTLVPLLADVCLAAGVAFERIGGATVAGNTTMLHLLAGEDPSSLGVAPFRPVFIEHRRLAAGEIGLAGLSHDCPIHLLPGFSSFVGADLMAGCVCTGLLHEPGPTLLVDVGTNGEILLQHENRLYATATAAGPAFEGGRLARGTRAVAGAVEHVRLGSPGFAPQLELIGPAAYAIGICGSAYVDYLAEARARRLLTASGRFDDAAWSALPRPHRYQNGSGRGICLQPNDAATIVTEQDVAQLLQAKAAIAAGIVTVLRRASLQPRDIRRLHLAGGFGLHIDVNHAIACGLLPGFHAAQVEAVGNTSLGGAWLTLVDRTILTEMSDARRIVEVIDLNREPGFEDAFIDHLLLP